jgi:hypothetical protein
MTEKKRRGVFAENKTWDESLFNANQPQAVSSPVIASPTSSLLNMMPVAEERQRRSRDWERSRRENAVSYRGIPPEIQTGIKSIAAEIEVNAEEVARAFLEFGLNAFRNGEIQIQPHPKGRLMTLFPEGWSRHVGWTDMGWGKREETSRGKKKRPPALWRNVVTYRGIPAEVKQAIQVISKEHYIPVGELATLFLSHAYMSFKNGRLVLHPQPKTRSAIQVDTSRNPVPSF